MRYLSVAILVFFFLELICQTGYNLEIDQDFHGIGFSEFVDIHERDHNVHFYYFPGWVEGLHMIHRGGWDFKDILDSTLAQTGLYWTMTRDQQILLTRTPIRSVEEYLFSEELATVETRVSSIATAPEVEEWLIIGDANQPSLSPRVELTGTVINAVTNKPMSTALVLIRELNESAYTDSLGKFMFQVPVGRYHLIAQGLEQGQVEISLQIFDVGDIVLPIRQPELFIDEILVEAERNQNVRNVYMGVTPLKMESIKELPKFLGETDIIKTLALLPGVQTSGELAQGFNVRGSGSDQNLVLLNRMPIFNISHLFGFTSAFNPDVITGLELYKSSIPAKFGGRIASVTDIQMKIADKSEWQVQGGISPIAARVTVEAPLQKQKTSLLVSGRSSYADWILKRLNQKALRNSSASYYDVTARLHHQAQQGTWDVSGYASNDKFNLNGDTTFAYQNRNLSVLYRLPFSNNKYGSFSMGWSGYDFNLSSDNEAERAFQLDYAINQIQARGDINHALNRHQISYGVQLDALRTTPGSLSALGDASLIREKRLENELGVQADIYVSDVFQVSDRFELSAGLRWSNYFSLGPGTSHTYQSGQPKELQYLLDTLSYKSGELRQYYGGPSYRISSRYSINDHSSIKFSANRTRQYLSLLINTTTISPTAFWQLANEHIQPQISDQLSIGWFGNWLNDHLETSIELYYKWIKNVLDYKSGAQLILNEYLETDVINAKGKGYGLELLIKKRGKILDGWIAYTYSRSFIQASSVFPEATINRGEFFPSYYDQPHEVVMVANYNLSRRISLSTNVTYSTGRPLTLPIAKYQFNNAFRLYYSARNEFRVPDYFRTDVSLNIKGNHKLKKKVDSSWSISIYNITGRRNPYSVYFISDGDDVRGYKLSIYGRPIGSLSYNFKF